MQIPNSICQGINKVGSEEVISAIMALGLDHTKFIFTNIGGLVVLLANENYGIDPFKLNMLRVTLETFNAEK